MQSIFPRILLVSVQLLAILLLQVPIFLPLLGKVMSSPARGATCYHDHRLCGCSAERIASKTCCCARSAEAARLAADPGEADDDSSCCQRRPAAKARHTLMMAPCGAASPLFVSSVQDYLFVPYSGKITSPVVRDLLVSESPGRLCPGHFDPPDPPPKKPFFA